MFELLTKKVILNIDPPPSKSTFKVQFDIGMSTVVIDHSEFVQDDDDGKNTLIKNFNFQSFHVTIF